MKARVSTLTTLLFKLCIGVEPAQNLDAKKDHHLPCGRGTIAAHAMIGCSSSCANLSWSPCCPCFSVLTCYWRSLLILALFSILFAVIGRPLLSTLSTAKAHRPHRSRKSIGGSYLRCLIRAVQHWTRGAADIVRSIGAE